MTSITSFDRSLCQGLHWPTTACQVFYRVTGLPLLCFFGTAQDAVYLFNCCYRSVFRGGAVCLSKIFRCIR